MMICRGCHEKPAAKGRYYCTYPCRFAHQDRREKERVRRVRAGEERQPRLVGGTPPLNHSSESSRTEWRLWYDMVRRCTDSRAINWKYYGGRGLTVARKWRKNFAAFYEDVGPRPSPEYTLDRIDNDGNYEPGNVRWATRKEQQANTRRSK